MTTQAECAAAAPILTTAAGWAGFAGQGAGNGDGVDFIGPITDANGNTFLGSLLSSGSAALSAIGLGGSQAANTAQSYMAWSLAASQAALWAQNSGDAISTQLLRTASAVLNNLANGV
jgi:hypothetical protein